MLSPKQDFSTFIYVLYLPFLWGIKRGSSFRLLTILGGLQTKFLGKKKNFFYANQVMKRSEMHCSSKGRIWGMCVSARRGNFQIMRAGIKRNSNVRTRKGAECACFRCVCQRERAGTREIKSWEIRSEIEWSFTELLSHWKTDRTDVGKTELYLQRSDTSQNNEMPSSIWAVRGSCL